MDDDAKVELLDIRLQLMAQRAILGCLINTVAKSGPQERLNLLSSLRLSFHSILSNEDQRHEYPVEALKIAAGYILEFLELVQNLHDARNEPNP